MDLILAMGTFGFIVALGVFAFNIAEFRATRKDLARLYKGLARHEERMAKMMTEHGRVLRDIRDSLVGRKRGKHFLKSI